MCLPSGCTSSIAERPVVLIPRPSHENSLPESCNIVKKWLGRLKLSARLCTVMSSRRRTASCEIPAQSWSQQSLFTVLHLSWSSLILVWKRFIIPWDSLYQSHNWMLQAIKNAVEVLRISSKTFWQSLGRGLQHSILYTCMSLGNKSSLAMAVWRLRHPALLDAAHRLTWQSCLPGCSWSFMESWFGHSPTTRSSRAGWFPCPRAPHVKRWFFTSNSLILSSQKPVSLYLLPALQIPPTKKKARRGVVFFQPSEVLQRHFLLFQPFAFKIMWLLTGKDMLHAWLLCENLNLSINLPS